MIRGKQILGFAEQAQDLENYVDEAVAEGLADAVDGLSLGAYDASTNSPTLTATPPSGLKDGAFYLVDKPGVLNFVGGNFPSGQSVNIGDKIYKQGTKWECSLLPQNTAKIATWIAQSYVSGSQVLYGDTVYVAQQNTASTDEPGVSTIWELLDKTKVTNKLVQPYKVICNSNFQNGQKTDYDQNNTINGLRIVINGLQDFADAIKIPLDVRGTYLVIRVYEGSKIIDSQKITISKKEIKQFYFAFTHRLQFKTGIDYNIEITSDAYLGFFGVTRRGNTIPYKDGFYRFSQNPTVWSSAWNGQYGIGFELLKNQTANMVSSVKREIVKYNSRNSFFDGVNGFSGWGFALNFTKKTIINAIIVRLDYVNYNDSITLNIWKRAIDDNSLINESDTEVFVQQKTYVKTVFQDIEGQQDCLFNVDSFEVNENEKVVFEIVPNKLDNGNVVAGKLGIATYGDTSKNRNYMFCYKQGGGLRYGAVNSSGNFPSVVVLGECLNSKMYAADNYSIAVYDNNLTEIDCGQGNTYTETISNFTVNPNADNSPIFWTQLRNSANQAVINITDISIAGKTKGTDYEVNLGMGRIRSLGASFTATVTVTFYHAKRVALAKNVLDNTYLKVDSTAARTAALEYPVQVQNTYDILANFVLRWRTLVEINQARNRNFDALLQSKAFIKGMNFWKKLHAGQDLVIASYADSTYANQAGNPTYAANGDERDRIEYCWGILTDDYLGTVPIVNGHIKISLATRFVERLKKVFASNISYLNFSIAGTNSGDGLANGANAYSGNGRYAARLSEIVNSNANLVILGFGMNEIGSNNSFWNLKDIITQLQNATIPKEVILIDCFKPSAYSTWWTEESWTKTNNQIRLVAQSTNSGYVPLGKFLENGWEFSDGVGRCMQNMWNHPTPKEFENYAEMLFELIS